MPDWSPQQAQALDRVSEWLRRKDKPFFQLAGYAGTGKTTLAKHLAEGVGGRVHFAAFTGKAAHVLSKSGAQNVSTIHKLIYQPKDKSQQHLRELIAKEAELKTLKPLPEKELEDIARKIEAERANLARPMWGLREDSPLQGASLLVVDEYSMVSEDMGRDLLTFGVPILALGDPGQLPPVQSAPFFRDAPDLLFTEIHRQAKDNPIIWMSQEIRAGRELEPGQYGTSAVARYRDIPQERLAERILQADQLLVGKNATRASSSVRVRELLGRQSELPEADDKLVCLRNNHDSGLLNGQIWYAENDCSEVDHNTISLSIRSEDDTASVECLAHQHYFHGRTPPPWDVKNAECFDYGYALTVHKSQGSQWPRVVLLDEWYGRDRRKWLYTAVTRASESVRIVQM